MLLSLALACVSAFVVGLVLTPLLRRAAHRWNITDHPDALLKPHARPIAYLGGVGFYLAWVAALAVFQCLEPARSDPRIWLIAGAGGFLLLVGLLDDIRNVRPWQRLLAEAAAAVLLFVCGARFLGVPGLPEDHIGNIAIGLALQVVLVIGACNSTNLLDGLDVLCGGVSAIVLLGLATLAAGAAWAVGAIHVNGEDVSRLRMVVILAGPMAAALAAFLVYNYRPASIFMGDAGSLLLGFVIASLIVLLGVPSPDWTGLTLAAGGMMVFAEPVADAALAFIRRAINRRPIFSGDRSHFYDQLVDRKLPVTRVVKLCYAISAVFAAVGWIGAVWIGTFAGSLSLYVAAAVLVCLLLWKFGFVRVDKRD
jgi:UDP-GlcNAc:undecaprenyl-phosphate GlcNAc-1-phosphate transferase